jgi:hypothetical protein
MNSVDWVKGAALTIAAGFGLLDSVGAQCFEAQKLLANDGAEFDEFGLSVSVDANVAVVGAYHDDDAGEQSGAAYVYRYNGSQWTQEQKLLASDGATGDIFGYDVSVSGNVVVVGAPYNDDVGSNSNSGSAYVYQYNGSTWVQEQKLLASDAALGDRFGWSVAVDGNVAIIGAPTGEGAYVFRFGSQWLQETELSASDGANEDNFGHSVSLSGDVALIGAFRHDHGPGPDSGAAYLYRYNGAAWPEEAELLPNDGSADDQFGSSVSVDGDVAVVGAYRHATAAAASGSAYVYNYDGTSWVQKQELSASDGAASDYFGFSVSLDGNVAVIGAYHDDNGAGARSGSAYLYRRDGTQWNFKQKLLASDSMAHDLFGFSVSVSGNIALVTAWGDDDNGMDAGSAYVLDLAGPVHTAVVPNQGPFAGNNLVTIAGHGFTSDTTVLFGGVFAAVTTVDCTTLNVVVPPYYQQFRPITVPLLGVAVDVTVSNGCGTSVLQDAYTYSLSR